MKAQLAALIERIDTLSLRERVLAGAATGLVLGAVLYSGFIAPAENGLKTENLALETTRSERATQVQQLERLRLSLATDPDAERRAELAGLRQQIDLLGQELAAAELNLINPEQMLPLLRDLVDREHGLELLSMQALAPEALRWQPAAAPAAAAGSAQQQPPAAGIAAPAADAAGPVIYRHAVEMEFRGDYAGALRYLRAIEALPARLGLGRFNLEVDAWPRLRVRLRVFTLSLQEGWVGV